MLHKLSLMYILLHLTSASLAAAEPWQRDQRDLLTNFNNMYNPCVIETPGEYRFKMWFFGWAEDHTNSKIPGCDAIFHARSQDLLRWEVYSGDDLWDTSMDPSRWQPVLHASERWYESWHVGDPSVVLHDGRFYMAYSATSKPFEKTAGFPATMVQCIMGAESPDGIDWTKSAQPLLIRTQDTDHPPPQPDRIGDFHRPSLHRAEDRWQLWFDYWLPGSGVCLGYAENRGEFMQSGGFAFQHNLEQPLLKNWPNPSIVRIGDAYHCFADPPGYPLAPGESRWKSRQLREARSPDGMNWKVLDFIDPDSDADACHVPQAVVLTRDGTSWLYLFYATQVGTKRNDGVYHYQYDRIRAMRRPL
jgi:hypothetical protein